MEGYEFGATCSCLHFWGLGILVYRHVDGGFSIVVDVSRGSAS